MIANKIIVKTIVKKIIVNVIIVKKIRKNEEEVRAKFFLNRERLVLYFLEIWSMMAMNVFINICLPRMNEKTYFYERWRMRL